jgi:hypothetical protein
VGLLLLLVFVSFNLIHPTSDLLCLVSHHQSVEHPAPVPPPLEDPTGEAHAPCVLPQVPSLVPPPSSGSRLTLVAPGPEDRFLSVPSPIPIAA